MKNLRLTDIGRWILSFFLAFVLWFVVVSMDDPMTSHSFTQIPVEITNTASVTNNGQIYEVLDGTNMVSIVVTAKRSVINSLGRDNFKAVADMSKMENNLVPIEVKATRYADRIDNIVVRTRNVKVAIENLREVQMTIQCEFTGNVADGYAVGDVTLDKNVIKISGPESVVNEIDHAAVLLNVSGMTGDISTSESIRLLDKNGDEVDRSELTLNRTEVNIQAEIWETKEIPLSYGYIGTPAEGFGMSGQNSINPATITIAGRKKTLDAIGVLALPHELVDISDATETVTKSIHLSTYLPDGTKLASKEEDAEISIGIIPYATKTVQVPTVNIAAVNVPEGYQANFGGLGQFVNVEVRGLGDAYENLDPMLITGIADIGTIEIPEGTEIEGQLFECPVQFNLPEGVLSGNNNVRVNVVLYRLGEDEKPASSNTSTASEDREDKEENED